MSERTTKIRRSRTIGGWEAAEGGPASAEADAELLTSRPGLGLVLTSRATSSLIYKTGPRSQVLLGGKVAEARPDREQSAVLGSRSTHLEHDFIDGSSVRFKVEVFVVMIA